MKAFIALAAALGLAACAAQTSTTGAPEQTRTLDTARLAGGPAMARALLSAGESYLPPEGHVNAVVLLTSDTKSSRAEDMCEAWRKMPTIEEMAADSDSPVNATYWPVTGAMGAQPTCKHLVAAYDYNRGRAIASRFGALGPKGPSLVVVQDEAAFFLVDMSKANERTIDELMSNWYQVAVSGSDEGQSALVAEGGGGILAGMGGIAGISCAALDVVSLGVPVVDLAGKLICGKA
jgi:hypothetical protein